MPDTRITVPPVGALFPADRLPGRVMRSRRRGARSPEGTIYVGRPTIFGNPFVSDRFGHARAVLMYEALLECRISDLVLERHGFCPAQIDALHRLRDRVLRSLPQLRRRDLSCWCPLTSSWCHADVLLRHANEDISKAAFFAAAPSPFSTRTDHVR